MKNSIPFLFVILAISTSISCSDDNECKKECVGNVAYTCEDGKSVQKDCGLDICLNGACIPQHICDTDDLRCEAGIPQKCTNNTWVNQPACTQGQECRNGLCEIIQQSEDCTENAKSCTPNGIPEKCMNKQWVILSPCSDGTTCKDGECKANQAACTENAKQCDNGVPQKCENGQWIPQQACASGSKCEDGECKSEQTDQKTPREQLSCAKGEQAKCQKTSDGHTWAVICHDGDVEDDDWAWPEDCTELGMPCTSEKVAYEDGGGTYMDAWCKCTTDDQCKAAYSDATKCVDNYCE